MNPSTGNAVTPEQFAAMTPAEQFAYVQGLQNRVAKAESKESAEGVTFKVGDKGGISIYGLGRWPVTLYVEQAEKLFTAENVQALHDFCKKNTHLLKRLTPAEKQARRDEAKAERLAAKAKADAEAKAKLIADEAKRQGAAVSGNAMNP
jgi:hypothetical protein